MWIDNFSSYVIYCQRISSSRLGAEATPDLYLHNPEQGIGDLAGLGRFGTQGVSPTHCLRFVPSSCQAPVIKIYSNGNPIGFFLPQEHTPRYFQQNPVRHGLLRPVPGVTGWPPLRAIIEVLEALPPPETEAAANTESLSTGWGEGPVC